MSLYQDSELSIRSALLEAHEQTMASFASAGVWFTGAERAAIVAEARAARVEAGLQKDAKTTEKTTALPEGVRRVARLVGVSTNTLDHGFYEQALADGLSDNEYAETVGVVSRASSMDVFARGIGVVPRTIPTPDAGAPSRKRPQTARDEGAWTHTVPGGRRGKQEAIDTYGTNTVEGAPFIYRALSLVPPEAQGLVALGRAQYADIDNFMDMNFSFEPTITRVQVELLAARVSAINECFY